MTFQELNLEESLLRALKEEGYDTPTPIQAQSIPHSLKGRDLLACAQTGTGKTAAFALPILQKLHGEHLSHQKERPIKALILTPTRELAIQIEESFKAYGRHMRLRKLVIFGGVGQNPQVEALKRGVDILVATPGRLLDLMNQGYVHLNEIEVFVLDEADRMLDMGFIHDVRRVIKQIPEKRQTLFFSATMPPEIAKLANDILTDPVKVAVTPISTTVEAIQQSVFFVDKKQKRRLLHHLLNTADVNNALVFTRTKHGANRVAQDLNRAGISAMAIHGNKSQSARQQALQNFKTGEIRVLVATDIAARGIDIDDLTHVVNFDLPNIPETYVHRIGRTGRAGASGVAFSFCDEEEKAYLRDIQRLIGLKIPIVEDHPYPLGQRFEDDTPPPQERPRRDDRRSSSQQRNRPPQRSSGRQESAPATASSDAQKEKSREERQERDSRRSSNRRRNRPPRRNSNDQNQRREPRPPQAEKQKPASQESKPAAEKPEKPQEKQDKWSSSIFKETTGKKGFIIKSDRDENRSRRGNRPPNRGGRK
jgi:ATP-dependent RNA helicase RhlE